MRKLIVATKNQGKVHEIKELLCDLPFRILSLKDIGLDIEINEDQDTFEKNALKKAIEIMKKTGEITLADDSGLEVYALNGQPGIHSARFSGACAKDEENNAKLLKMMEKLPEGERDAHFLCAIALVYPEGTHHIVKGYCNGEIAFSPRGNDGFGYDPLFIVKGLGKTFAELNSKVKNDISHRGIALKKIRNLLYNQCLSDT